MGFEEKKKKKKVRKRRDGKIWGGDCGGRDGF